MSEGRGKTGGEVGGHGSQRHEDHSSHSDQDFQLGVALVSILVSLMFSVGFGLYSVDVVWWLAVLLAIATPAGLALLIRVGGEDGVIPRVGRWMLGTTKT